MTIDIKGRHILSAADLEPNELRAVLDAAIAAKKAWAAGDRGDQPLAGKQVALLFEKPSLRTRVSFEVGLKRLGAAPLYMSPQEVGLGKRESVEDVAKVISRYVDAIVCRTFAHANLEELARHGSVPIVNALCDAEHPCQAYADLQTILEHRGSLEGQRMVYVGDGNNVAASLCLAGARAGVSVTVACPKGYEMPDWVIARSTEIATAGATFAHSHDPSAAVEGADVLYTDVWASMGQEAEAAERKKAFAGFRIDSALLARAKDDAIVLHCLPAHYDEEIEHAVAHGPRSAIWDQAENRLHAQQALLRFILS